MRLHAGAIVSLLLVACTPGTEPMATDPPRHVHLVGGTRYDKSFYDEGAETVVSFRLRVRSTGRHAGRDEDLICHTSAGGRRYPMEVLENPRLAPGEWGWLSARAVIPRVSARVAENLEPDCDLRRP